MGPKVANFLVTSLFRSLMSMLNSINSTQLLSVSPLQLPSVLNPNQFVSPKARCLCSSVTSQKIHFTVQQDTFVWVPFLFERDSIGSCSIQDTRGQLSRCSSCRICFLAHYYMMPSLFTLKVSPGGHIEWINAQELSFKREAYNSLSCANC